VRALRNLKPRIFPIQLELAFKVISKDRVWCGSGSTLSIGSKELAFTADRPLEAGMTAEISLVWPSLLENRVRLQLVLETSIARVLGNRVEARISRYRFRTRGARALMHTTAAGWESPAAGAFAYARASENSLIHRSLTVAAR
jgi:hypothetical protein